VYVTLFSGTAGLAVWGAEPWGASGQ